ncbi:hypothetical protein HY450_00180 [Candidatus Pacearchaeota archaeon]|nr:hypothetical protein [Candidatus Pacearchaeota archaeon]
MNEHKNKAPWIVVTGLDGTGKTTLIKSLAEEYGECTFTFYLPYSDFVIPALKLLGGGTPFGDVQTDRLIFATDARLTNEHLKNWRDEYNRVLSQRGWMDNFIHGKVQGVSYQDTYTLLQPQSLERASGIIYLNADANVAFARIENDHNGDKYETLEYMKRQADETQSFYDAVRNGSGALDCFQGVPSILYNTTNMSMEETKKEAKLFLENLL